MNEKEEQQRRQQNENRLETAVSRNKKVNAQSLKVPFAKEKQTGKMEKETAGDCGMGGEGVVRNCANWGNKTQTQRKRKVLNEKVALIKIHNKSETAPVLVLPQVLRQARLGVQCGPDTIQLI